MSPFKWNRSVTHQVEPDIGRQPAADAGSRLGSVTDSLYTCAPPDARHDPQDESRRPSRLAIGRAMLDDCVEDPQGPK
jgi:hypothetical protein